MSIVEDTERTRFCPQTDNVKPVYPPFNFVEAGGIIKQTILPGTGTGLILALHPANERCCYFVTTSLIGRVQTYNRPWGILWSTHLGIQICGAYDQRWKQPCNFFQLIHFVINEKAKTAQDMTIEIYTYNLRLSLVHDDTTKWKHFLRNWLFVWGIHWSPVNSPHKSQWHGALIFSLICAWIHGWVNNRDTGDFRRHCAHYYVIVMGRCKFNKIWSSSIKLLAIKHGKVSSKLMAACPCVFTLVIEP